MIKFSDSNLEYIKENVLRSIEIIQKDNPNEIESYAKENFKEIDISFERLNNLLNSLEYANSDDKINQEVEEFCIWGIGMWVDINFDIDVEDLHYENNESYIDLYQKIMCDENGNRRYKGYGSYYEKLV